MSIPICRPPSSLVTDPHLRAGCIRLILGPMFSGKTTELIRLVRRHFIADYNCALVKYAKDTRYSDDLVATHDGLASDQFDAMAATNLTEILDKLMQYDVIGIDEGQFFPDVVDVCEQLANNGIIVFVSALDGDYKREAFPTIANLIPKAEYLQKLQAICTNCRTDGAFTKRLVDGTERELIGGADKYSAACRKCHAAAPSQFLHSPNLGVKSRKRNPSDLATGHSPYKIVDTNRRTPGKVKKIQLGLDGGKIDLENKPSD